MSKVSDMVTCKDCIHYERCDTIFDGLLSNRDNEPCYQFDDKSRYIELPCKVGDTMYVKYRGVVRSVKVNAIRLDTKKNNHRICVWGTFHLYEHYSHEYKATFPFDSIGKSLFSTEAEAMRGGAE
jgi:hypothetical protein